MQQVARQARTRPPSLIHRVSSRRLHAKHAILAIAVGQHDHTALPLVRGGGTATGGLNAASSLRVGNIGGRLGGGVGVRV